MIECLLHVWGVLFLEKYYTRLASKELVANESINIVCLGESSTSGLWVDQEDSYPSQLETMLKKYYDTKNIHVIVPPHVGQNTSQVANRIYDYIKLYKPIAIVMMVGCNNHWSLTESHITKFLSSNSFDANRMKIFVFLNNFHIFKILRYAYISVKYDYTEGWGFKPYIAGAPQSMGDSPEWVLKTFNNNKAAFLKLWIFDVKMMVKAAKNAGIPVIFMTYPVPISIPTAEFLSIADTEQLILVRNDIDFNNLKRDEFSKYIFSRDNWHPTKKGYTIVAKNAFNVIIENHLIK